MGTLEIGGRTQGLVLVLVRDQDLIDTIRQQAGKGHATLPEGTPIDWPEGTAAWFTVRNRGSAVDHKWPLEVDGPYLRVDVDYEDVNKISADAKARLWIQYPESVSDGRPFVFVAGPVEWSAT